ncbi:uncharacterized protein LOC130699663 [Daphnia carinata]|uniref:uncharacterized protein LOC130699663 n=1 Tax=Daphnia carinata TaxID=120202 RepID=UPI0028697997|nr:uncharacterized protein LOC130699663 [Daphnia carinata]
MPNEYHFEAILQTGDVSKYYPCKECKQQTFLDTIEIIECITTSSLRYSTVKNVSAIPILEQENASMGHLVISPSQLQPLEEKNSLMLCLMASVENENRGPVCGHNDDVTLGENESVGRLVGTKPKDYEESLYIPRRVKFAFGKSRKSCPLHKCFIADLAKRLECPEEKLSGECRISLQGQIEWLGDTNLKRRNKIWENIAQMNDQTSGEIEEESHLIEFDERCKKIWKTITEIIDSAPGVIYDESHLIWCEEKLNEHPVVIICGVAGTGKSTLLSHYYSEIKKKKPDCWVIRLNLVEHADAILKLDRSTPDLIGFLIDDMHVIDSKSPFSRSLLNDRYDTGKLIVFMFDGYDEIGEECQEIVIQMMKSIQKKGIQLYVTTRSHMAHHLQYELCQLAYYLENFNKEDQISCLAKYWKKELKLEDRKIEEFAELLVDRVSDTLKDEERAFIGIPLQCRILAECYQQNVDDVVRSNAENEVTRQSGELASQKLLALLDDQQFDLVSLYSKLMGKKRNIFLLEKTNTSKSDDIKDDAITILLKKIESRLTKWAVETIITKPNILEMFWPAKISHKSSDDVAHVESVLAKNALKFGLTFSNGDGMRPQFLHRTFAEYLVAKYLYKGFHPDDNRHNKLLENESIRKLIVNKILASKEYDGVQVFFDGMVKTLVDENEEWSKKINDRKLPDRFTKMMTHESEDVQPYFEKAIHFSILNWKGNIFRLFCDCLDATFEKHQVSQFVMRSLIGWSPDFYSRTFFEESKFFKRFINYFGIDPRDQNVFLTDDYRTSMTIERLVGHMFPDSVFQLKKNRDGHLETLDDLLEFLDQRNVAFDKYLRRLESSEDDRIKNALLYLICHDKYRSNLKRFLALLSKSEAYSDDTKFANLLIIVFQSEKQLMTGRIAETLTILDGLGRSSLLVQLTGEVLSKDPEAFQNIYQPCRLAEEDAIPTKLAILLERDSYDMTLLHRAAFYGDVNIVEQILARFRQLKLRKFKKAVPKVMLQGFTPFYFAMVKNHKEVCSKLLAFVKDIFPNAVTGELTELNRSIRQSLDHAMKSENVEMFQLILNVVKKELGHACLLHLVTTTSTFPGDSIFDYCRSKKLFNAMVKIIVNRDDVVDYKCLHDLIFNKYRRAKSALERIDAENLQGLLSVEGAGPFTKRFITGDLEGDFVFLSSHLLENFDKTQLLDFVQTITIHAERAELRSSIWVVILGSKSTYLPGWELGARQVGAIVKCLTCVSNKLGGDCAKELLLHKDDRGYVVRHLSPKTVKLMLNCLPEKNQEEIKKEWKEKVSPMTHDTFIKEDSKVYGDSRHIALHYSDIFLFYLVYGSEMQLSNCVDILTSTCLIGRKQRSLWSYIFKYCPETKTNEILKSVSQIFGWEAVLLLLNHEMDGSPLLLKALLRGNDIDGRLDVLPVEKRNDIQLDIEQKAADFIDELFLHPETYFNVLDGPRFKRLTLLKFVIDYSNGRQREQFVHNITRVFEPQSLPESLPRVEHSIWTWVLLPERGEKIPFGIVELDTFLKRVSEKLGTKAVKELVLHEFRNQPFIYFFVEGEYRGVAHVMLAHLDAIDRTQICSQIDEFLRR